MEFIIRAPLPVGVAAILYLANPSAAHGMGTPLATHAFLGGAAIDAMCQRDRSACSLYVEGAADGYTTALVAVPDAKPMCVPPGFAARQATDIVIGYLAAHPEKRIYAAADIVADALAPVFSCR